MRKETQALADLRDDVLRDEPRAGVELQVGQSCQQFLWRQAGELGQRDRIWVGRILRMSRGSSGTTRPTFQRQFHCPSDAIEALAVADGAQFAVRGGIIGIEGAQRVGDLIGHFLFLIGLQHPVVDATVAAAGGAPAARGVEREVFWVEFGEGLAAGDVGAGGGEPRQYFTGGRQQEAGALAELEGQRERGGDFLRGLALEVGDDDFDVVLLVAVELGEGVDALQAAVDAHELVALLLDPLGDGLVVALAAADERGAEVEVLGLLRLRRDQGSRHQGLHLAGRKRGDGAAGFRVVLHAGAGIEEAQVLGDFGDRGDGGLARAAGDALLDGDRGRDAGEAIDVRTRQLFDELARVGRHGLHEAPLALGEDDVERESRLARARHAGDHGEFAVRDRDGDVLQVVLSRSKDLERR